MSQGTMSLTRQEQKQREFAIALGKLVAESIGKGLYHDNLIAELKGQWEAECRLRAGRWANERSY